MTETTEMDMCDVDVEKLDIHRPKKLDGSLFAKVRYSRGTKLSVFLRGVTLLRCKPVNDHANRYYTLELLSSRACRRKVAEIDDHFVKTVIDNLDVWFTKGLEESVIDEFFKRSLVTSASGTAIRFKIQDDIEPLEAGRYDVGLCFKGLRFFKHTFIPEWELLSAGKVGSSFLDADADADENADEEDPVPTEDVLPDEEDMRTIRAHLESRLRRELDALAERRADIDRRMDRLGQIALRFNGKQTLRDLNDLADELERA